jgi:hypothetical protein
MDGWLFRVQGSLVIRSRWTVLVLTLLGVALAREATAQQAEAEQLFRDGRRLMSEGKYAEACVAFEASNRLDPATSTVLNLGDCREKNGQIASAWTAFLEAERQTRGAKDAAKLARVAKERVASLEARLSYLTISVPDESRVAGLVLTRNGLPLDEALWNRAIPMDGGTYVIGGRAPGHEEWSTTVAVPAEHGRITVDVPKFKDVDALVGKPPPPGSAGGDDDDDLVDDPGSSLTGRRKLALGVAGLGALAAGAGIAAGLPIRGLEDEARALCPGNPCADADAANALGDRARRRALLANVSFGVAAAAVVGAAVLWLTGGPDDAGERTALSPVFAPGFAGLDLAVRF